MTSTLAEPPAGAQRPRVDLRHADCREVLAELPDASVDAIVTDPPYELAFMARAWDASGIAYNVDLWRECLRVLKPGGHLVAFGGTRTYHRMTCAIEDAGFEIRDSLHWLYGSGFPKSLDVSKAIDKVRDDRADSDAAEQWQGWGTALKPAHEPIVLARRPLVGTVAANVLAHGTGGINVDGTRVSGSEDTARPQGKSIRGGEWSGNGGRSDLTTGGGTGRWPSNVLITHDPGCNGVCADGCPVAELDQQSGTLKSGQLKAGHKQGQGLNYVGKPTNIIERDYGGDSGGASRFFPTFRYSADSDSGAKAAGHGPDPRDGEGRKASSTPPVGGGDAGFESPPVDFPVFRYQAKAPTSERPKVDGKGWPTVKPLGLMRWLVRLVTPPGGLVLDPFAGTGTTLQAAALEGFRSLGVERDPLAYQLALQRLATLDHDTDEQHDDAPALFDVGIEP